MELDMTKGNPFQLIVKFIVPLIIGNIFQQFYNMADTIIVGRFIGIKALAAVGSTGTIMFLIIGFMQGLTTGFTVLTAQRFGAGDMEGLKKSVGNATILSIVMTIVMTVVSVLGMDHLLTIMNTPDNIYADAKKYIIIICLGLGCNILYNLLSSMLRAVGNTKIPLYFLTISVVLNVILVIVFIVFFHMGVEGAALATVISQGVSGILCLWFISKKVPILHINRSHLKLDYQCARNQLSIGLPMALQFSITAIGTIMVQSALNMLGSTAIAAYTAASKVEQLVTQPFPALGMTMATYCAQNRGINDCARIKKGVRISNIMSAIYSIVIAVIVVSAVPYIIPLFVTGDITEIVKLAKIYIIISSCFYIPLGMIFIYRNTLQGSGYSVLPMIGGVVELVSRGIVAFIAASYMSFTGVCFANVSAWASAAIFLWIAYLYTVKKWKKEGMFFVEKE